MTQLHAKHSNTDRIFVGLKKIVWVGSILLSILALLPVLFSVFVYFGYFYQFKQTANLTNESIIQLAKKVQSTQVNTDANHVNFLILGVDSLSNRQGDPELTDTIMLMSLNLLDAGIRTVSLPRDLWNTSYKTKINALYEYGKSRYPEHPEQFSQEVIGEMTQVPIHHIIVMTLDQLAELVDIIGGVTINIDQSFVDEQFPRSDVDIRTETDPRKLYMTVEFKEGAEKMNGQRVLQFVRSRHSDNLDQGTDNSRAVRQQKVIEALIETLKSPDILKNASTLGKVYDWYNRHFHRFFAIEEALAIAVAISKNIGNVSFESQSLSVSNPTDKQNSEEFVFFHPPVSKYNQWVYEISDEQKFPVQIQQALGLE